MKKSIVLLLSMAILSFAGHQLKATNYYWVNGGGNWSDHLNHWATTSGGTTFHAVVPSPFDNVYFDANSGFTSTNRTVNVDQTIETCLDMDWSNAPASPILSGPSTNTLKIYGSLKFIPAMSLSFFGRIYFEATSTGNTITSAGKVFNNDIYFQGVNGGWTLADAMNTGSYSIIFYSGIFNTNNNSVNCYSFSSSPPSTAARSILLGSSVVTMTSSSSSAFYLCNDNLTLNATSSTLLFTGSGGGISLSSNYGVLVNLSFNNVEFTNSTGTSQIYYSPSYGIATFNVVTFVGSGRLRGNFTFDSLMFSAGKIYEFEPNRTQTIQTLLSAPGTCNAPITLRSTTGGQQSSISKTSGTVLVDYGILRDMIGTGGASFIANNSTDLGNNSGWTINMPTPRNLYWVPYSGSGTGNWDDSNHWSLTSGGTGGQCIPSANDNVFFDGASFTGNGQTCTVNINAACKDMTWTGAGTYNPNFAGPSTNVLNIYGSLTFISAMNLSFSGRVYFEANTTGKTITSASQIFKNDVYFEGVGGGWTLLDAFNTGSYSIIYYVGTLNTNSRTVTCYSFSSSPPSTAPRVLLFGTSLVTMTSSSSSAFYLCNDNLTMNATSSTLRFTGSGGGISLSSNYGVLVNLNFNNAEFTNVTGTSQIYYSPSYGIATFNVATFSSSGRFRGNFTFDSLMFTSGMIYEFEPNRTQTIQTLLSANGTCNSPITMRSTTSGSQSTISKTTGSITISYTSLRDMVATGGALFTANNSTDLGNNTGWIINSPTPRNHFWVGGNGNWDQTAHWSLSSGGSGGQCIPNAYDNVFFDNNSFSGSGQACTININAVCRDIDWTGAQYTPTFSGSSTNILSIYGSLKFISAMNLSFSGRVYFEATSTGKTITTAGKTFNNDVYFQGYGGGWSLLDAMNTGSYSVIFYTGSLNTNNNNLNCYSFSSSPPSTAARIINFGTSVITMTSSSSSAFYLCNDNLTFNATSSIMRFTGSGGGISLSSNYGVLVNLAFNKTEFNNTTGTSQIYYSPSYGIATFSKATFLGNGRLRGNFTFDTLKFSPGKTYEIEVNRTETILSQIDATGVGGFPIDIRSTTAGQQGTLSKASGCVVLDFLQLRDNNATGGA
ncbi:MAG: hypothetical protein WCM76_15215, partial [Bacteroidota bacterium]